MNSNEKIYVHLLSVWMENKKWFHIGGREGMLFLTNKNLVFIHKTKAKMKWWKYAVSRQIIIILKTKNIMHKHDGYNENNLKEDLEDKRNLQVEFSNILKIDYKELVWGNVLNLEFNNNGEKIIKKRFSVVQDWVKYPIKQPMKHMKINWKPFVEFVKNNK